MQTLNIFQFVQMISSPGGKLQTDNEKAIKELLRHANHFHLFDVCFDAQSNGQADGVSFSSELWQQTCSLLSCFDENVLKGFLKEGEEEKPEQRLLLFLFVEFHIIGMTKF